MASDAEKSKTNEDKKHKGRSVTLLDKVVRVPFREGGFEYRLEEGEGGLEI